MCVNTASMPHTNAVGVKSAKDQAATTYTSARQLPMMTGEITLPLCQALYKRMVRLNATPACTAKAP